MKKLNLFLACAAVAVASMFGLSSCDKEDNPGNGGGSEDVVKTYDYEFFANDEILAEGDIILKVVKDGKSNEYNLKNGTAKTHTFNKNNQYKNPVDYKGKEMVFTDLKKGDTVEPKFVVKEGGLAPGGKMDVGFVCCPTTYTNGIATLVPKENDFLMEGLPNEGVLDYVNKRFAVFKFEAK